MIREHHKGRKSIDHTFLRKQWEMDDKALLMEKARKEPNKIHRVYGFGNQASMGYVPNETGFSIWMREEWYRRRDTK